MQSNLFNGNDIVKNERNNCRIFCQGSGFTVFIFRYNLPLKDQAFRTGICGLFMLLVLNEDSASRKKIKGVYISNCSVNVVFIN